MPVLTEQVAKRWTYEQYYALGDDQRCEVIGGELLMAPAPDTWHQDWIGELLLIFSTHVKARRAGKVFIAPVDVVLDEENTVQPDLVFIAAENLGIIQKLTIFGVPDLLVEVVSPASRRRDCETKRVLYQRFGVKEYWIGDTEKKSLEILALRNGQFERLALAEKNGRVRSSLLPGLEINVAELDV